MDYSTLLEMASELGYRLAMSGAETFRIEESINRILTAYGVPSEVFVIPNNMIVSIETEANGCMTQMRRIGYHGNDLDSVERYSNLSRKICSEKPDPHVALSWVRDAVKAYRTYSFLLCVLGCALCGCGYSVFFGGSILDTLCGCICGMIVGLSNRATAKLKINTFFSTIATTFLMSFAAYAFGSFGIADNQDTSIIGALMILVPGLMFTNAMRDIIFGDTNSGVNRIVQVLLIAAALALGAGAAWNLADKLWTVPEAPAVLSHPVWLQCLGVFIAGIGFLPLFNVHGKGSLLCVLGGCITWAAYSICFHYTKNAITSNFVAAVIAATYAEMMARIRKYPAISYLVISVFPLLPGAGIYYASNHLVRGNMRLFSQTAIDTIAIAGVLAVGILMVSTIVRLLPMQRKKRTS